MGPCVRRDDALKRHENRKKSRADGIPSAIPRKRGDAYSAATICWVRH